MAPSPSERPSSATHTSTTMSLSATPVGARLMRLPPHLSARRNLITCEELLDSVMSDASQESMQNGRKKRCQDIAYKDCLDYYVVDEDGAYFTCTQSEARFSPAAEEDDDEEDEDWGDDGGDDDDDDDGPHVLADGSQIVRTR